MMNIGQFCHGDFVMLGMYVAFVGGRCRCRPFSRRAVAAWCWRRLHRRLLRADPQRDEGADAGANPRHLRLALLLRYSVFWGFGANFLTLPENIVGGTFDVPASGSRRRGCWPRGRALLVTLGLHVLLTRTSLGSKSLRSPRTLPRAADGHPPRTMQAIPGRLPLRHRLAGALIAILFISRRAFGETLGIVAFVTVSLGGFAACPARWWRGS